MKLRGKWLRRKKRNKNDRSKVRVFGVHVIVCVCVCVCVCVSVCDVVGRIPKLGWLVLHICLLRVLLL